MKRTKRTSKYRFTWMETHDTSFVRIEKLMRGCWEQHPVVGGKSHAKALFRFLKDVFEPEGQGKGGQG